MLNFTVQYSGIDIPVGCPCTLGAAMLNLSESMNRVLKKELKKKKTKICHSAQSISQLSLGFCVFWLLHQYLPGLCLRAHVLQTCVHCVGMSGAFRGPFIHHQVDKSLILPRHNYAY